MLLWYCGTYLVPSVSYLTNTVLVHNQCNLFIYFPLKKVNKLHNTFLPAVANSIKIKGLYENYILINSIKKKKNSVCYFMVQASEGSQTVWCLGSE